MAKLFLCNYDQILKEELGNNLWGFIQSLDYFDRHGNTFVLVSMEDYAKVQRECMMIPYRYFISSGEYPLLIARENEKKISGKNRVELIETLVKTDQLFIDKREVYTLGITQSDIPMMEKFNGYTLHSADDKMKSVSLGTVSGAEEMLQMIRQKTIRKR